MNDTNGKPEESFSADHGYGKLKVLENFESVMKEYDDIFEKDHSWEANVDGILNETISKIQSTEKDVKYKYEKLVEMKDIVLEGKKELEAKIQVFEDDKIKMKRINESIENVITVNVGGVYYSTSRSTLCADQNSMLAAMFSGFHKLEKLKDGSYFIDANGKHFGIILDYLRGRIMYSGDLIAEKKTLVELRREVDFYNLLELKDLIDICLKRHQTSFSEWFFSYFKQENSNPVSYKSIKDADFRKFDFTKCQFKNVTFLHEANFKEANLSGAEFDSCNFCHSVSFKNALLGNAKFCNCTFAKDAVVSFDEADLHGCTFHACTSSESDKTYGRKVGCRSLVSRSSCVYTEKMSFFNARNIDKAHFPEGILELIKSCDKSSQLEVRSFSDLLEFGPKLSDIW